MRCTLWTHLFSLMNHLVPAGAGGLGAGRHPHSGLTALTYLSPDSRESTNYGKIKPWDNFSGFSSHNNAGGLYLIDAGQGVDS